jgi:hypothetical protein
MVLVVLIYFVDGSVRFARTVKDVGERKMQMLNHEKLANCKISTRDHLGLVFLYYFDFLRIKKEGKVDLWLLVFYGRFLRDFKMKTPTIAITIMMAIAAPTTYSTISDVVAKPVGGAFVGAVVGASLA